MLFDNIVDRPFLTDCKAVFGEAEHAAKRVLAADAAVVHKSCHTKALRLLSWADPPISKLFFGSSGGLGGAWKFVG